MTKHTPHGALLRPILFSTAMVQAIIEGRKKQTRRVVKPQPKDDRDWEITRLLDSTSRDNSKNIGKLQWALRSEKHSLSEFDGRFFECPYGQPGDILWVRERFMGITTYSENGAVKGFDYKADDKDWGNWAKWKPSIHMPFAAARIFLRVKSVRVERLQDISTEDCISEGLSTTLREHDAVAHLSEQWEQLWQSINGAESWDANPWVWVVEFERITREEAGV